MKTSNLYSFSLRDFVKGFILAILTVIASGLYTCLTPSAATELHAAIPPHLPSFIEIKQFALSGLGAGMIYLLKNFFTNNNDQFLKSDK